MVWKDFHRFQCFFASRSPQTEQVRKWKVNKTGRGKTNLIKRGKVIQYRKAAEETQKGLDASMLKEWNKWKEFNAVRRITKEDAQPLIDSGEAEVIPTQWVHIGRNEVLRLHGGQDVPEDLKSRLVVCGQFEK